MKNLIVCLALKEPNRNRGNFQRKCLTWYHLGAIQWSDVSSGGPREHKLILTQSCRPLMGTDFLWNVLLIWPHPTRQPCTRPHYQIDRQNLQRWSRMNPLGHLNSHDNPLICYLSQSVIHGYLYECRENFQFWSAIQRPHWVPSCQEWEIFDEAVLICHARLQFPSHNYPPLGSLARGRPAAYSTVSC